MVNVIVAFPKLEDAKSIRNLLLRNGFHVPNVTNSAAGLLQMANELESGIIVCGYKFKDMVYHDIKEYLPEEFQILLVSSRAAFDQYQEEDIRCLSMPVKVYELLQTLGRMVEESERTSRRRRYIPVKRSVQEKKLIDEAKEVLMVRKHLTEEEAHRFIQKNSMDNARSMVETAQMLLSLML